ncbi:MAG: IS110 family transposase [Eubacteriales bacterium]|nr:IS110 family transposase [Eubacteriales bacterium]
MNAVGIDVSKEKSTVAILSPQGIVVASPYDVPHTDSSLKELASTIKKLRGETRVVMEATGNYYEPIARFLHEQGIFVSVVNPILISDFGGNTLRKPKTDKKDAVKLAMYTLTYWLDLRRYEPIEDLRKSLKMLNRQYQFAIKQQTMMNNNLISQLDLTFPGINKLFTSPARAQDGHLKWVDFVLEFPHRDSVAKLSPSIFKKKYQRWCEKNGYYYHSSKADKIHEFAREAVNAVPADGAFILIITQAATTLNALAENANALHNEMKRIAEMLPEYDTVMELYGVGDKTGPQLMAEIGDTRRFHNRRAVTAYFGYDSENDDSGQKVSKSNPITKKGASALRRTLFTIMIALIQKQPVDNPVYQFLDKKRSEGKHYYCYMTAAANKFLRIYYAKVNEVLNAQSSG